MTNEREIERLEKHLMMFMMSLGEYGNTLDYTKTSDINLQVTMMGMQEVLVRCVNELEEKIELLKK